MAWKIHGRGFSFEVNQHGIEISGRGKHECPAESYFDSEMSKLSDLVADWSFYQASRASELAGDFSLNISDMKRSIVPGIVASARKPTTIIGYSSHNRSLSFNVFLPDQDFLNFCEAINMARVGPETVYFIVLGSLGFMARYREWLAGRPYISNESVRFRLPNSRQD